MILVIISLIISFAIAVVGIIFKEDDKKAPEGAGVVQRILANTKVRNTILILLNFFFLFISFRMVQGDMKESERLKTSVSESKRLLEEANVKMSKQSDIIIHGFEDLKNQMQRQGILSGNIDKKINTLAIGIETYTNESKNLFSSLDQSLSTKTNAEVIHGSNSFFIPSGYKNTVKIDSKNFIAINNEEKDLWVQVNHRKLLAKPAVPIRFIDENGKVKYIVYNGRVENKHEFSIVSGN